MTLGFRTDRYGQTVQCLNGAKGIANSADPDQTVPLDFFAPFRQYMYTIEGLASLFEF